MSYRTASAKNDREKHSQLPADRAHPTFQLGHISPCLALQIRDVLEEVSANICFLEMSHLTFAICIILSSNLKMRGLKCLEVQSRDKTNGRIGKLYIVLTSGATGGKKGGGQYAHRLWIAIWKSVKKFEQSGCMP